MRLIHWLVIMAGWEAPIAMVLGAAVIALGVTLSTPAFFSAIFATAGPGKRGAASGTASVFLDLGMGGGPILLGLAAQASGIPFAFGIAAAIAFAGGAWILLLSRTTKRQVT
jgi:predicted MFS family arabinose efflux permease